MSARTCSHCGELVAPDRNICKACGADIRETSEPAAPKSAALTPATPRPAKRNSLVIYLLIISGLVVLALVMLFLVRGIA
jgi:uncharacterized membrane protein YvbJ